MRPLTIAACFALTLAALSAHAQPQDPAKAPASTPTAPTPTAPAAAPAAAPSSKGNAETGRQLTYTCQGCHGVQGYKNAYPNYHVPKIVGQSPEYLVSALTEYKKGTRKHPTMQAQAQSFSDQDIADIAAFLSSAK
ncbi:c-type cytochrome [Lysobacter capsici]|uniref:c-type cytochrome n=1 Tax=Lysobacter capsici TaxID=435897 RepID=UPI001C0055D1|nr:cytochrome c [Lysobacter capsici]QWF19750.1 cytochrome c [Lysobacter capsici]